jgi:hypothetical protein
LSAQHGLNELIESLLSQDKTKLSIGLRDLQGDFAIHYAIDFKQANALTILIPHYG